MKISGNDGLVDGLGRVILQPMPDGDVADVERESHTIPERLQRLLTACSAGLVERDEETQLLLLAAVAGEHVLLIGPPGTAKSELARRLGLAFEGGPFFERLLTRFTVPEELFGPLSIKRLEQDEYHRLTDGYLPAASVAFLAGC